MFCVIGRGKNSGFCPAFDLVMQKMADFCGVAGFF